MTAEQFGYILGQSTVSGVVFAVILLVATWGKCSRKDFLEVLIGIGVLSFLILLGRWYFYGVIGTPGWTEWRS